MEFKDYFEECSYHVWDRAEKIILSYYESEVMRPNLEGRFREFG